MTAGVYADPRRVEAMARRTPFRRLGRPQDVSDSVFFLLFGAASFVTGIDLVVDGGLMARMSGTTVSRGGRRPGR